MFKLAIMPRCVLGLALVLAAVPSAVAQNQGFVRQPCDPAPDPNQLLPGLNCRNVVVDNHIREFLVYVPDGLNPGAPVPLVFMHHGSTGTMEQFASTSGWREVADQEGFVVVFPQGLQYYVLEDEDGRGGRWSTRWNMYGLDLDIDTARRVPGYPEASPWPANDVAFTLAMIDAVNTQLAVDDRRIFAAGFSNGAAFSTRLAHDIPNVIAAASPSGAGFAGGPQSCDRSKPRPTLCAALSDAR